MPKTTTNERRIKILIILLTILWHGLILYTFFVITRNEDQDPLRITVKPQVIEYLLDAVAQQQKNSIAQALPAMPAALQNVTQAQIQKQIDEEGFEQYLLKNAVSYGSYNQGSIVSMGQEGSGTTEPQQKDEVPEENIEPKESKQEEPKTKPEPEEKKAIEDKTTQNEIIQAEQSADIHEQEQDVSQNKSVVDSTSGMPPAIQLAEDILNNTGSSWISPEQPKETQKEQPPKPENRSQSTAQTNKSPAKAPANKQLTLADITKGYIKHMRTEQDATGHCSYNQGRSHSGSISRGAYAPPTDGAALSEQIYASKLYNLLEQSAQAYASQIYSCHDLEMETMIEVTIEKSGKILDVTLRPELPEKDMQQALCLIVKRVGLFPPIPRQFRKQRIILSIPIHIKSQQGFASYRLLYGLRATY